MRLATHRLFTLLALAPLFVSPSSTAAANNCIVPRLAARGAHHIDIISNKPFVYVTMNGSRPMHFVLDAGSPFTLLNTGVPQTVGFQVASERKQDNFVIREYAPKACVRTLGVTLSDIGIGDLELDHVSAVEGTRVDGLIGGELFQKYVVRIDYMGSRVDVFDADTYDYHGDGTVLPLTIDGLAFTDASVQAPDGRRVKGTFVVDTGVRMALLLNGPFVDKNGLLTGVKRVPRASVGVGVNGETRGDIFRVQGIELGGLTMTDVMSVASRDDVVIDSNDGLAGIIGGDLLRRFRVTLDYPHKRLILEETPETYAPFVYDRSGMFLLAEGEDYRTIRVHRVITGSPAEDAGIHAGDRLVSVDGKNARRLGLEATRVLFRADNTRYRLVLEREGALVTAQLMTKDLLETRAATVESSGG